MSSSSSGDSKSSSGEGSTGTGTDTGSPACDESVAAGWTPEAPVWLDEMIDRQSDMRIVASASELLVVDPGDDALKAFNGSGFIASWPIGYDVTAGNIGVADMDNDQDLDVAIFADNSDLAVTLRRDGGDFCVNERVG